MTNVKLIERLIDKQDELTDQAFAEQLGISRPAWSMLRRGLREPEADTLGRILKVFPDLAEDVFDYLLGGTHERRL